jgi:nucleoid DNA-binding protein
MNKTQLIDKIWINQKNEGAILNKYQIAEIINATFVEIMQEVRESGLVMIHGFGKFELTVQSLDKNTIKAIVDFTPGYVFNKEINK